MCIWVYDSNSTLNARFYMTKHLNNTCVCRYEYQCVLWTIYSAFLTHSSLDNGPWSNLNNWMLNAITERHLHQSSVFLLHQIHLPKAIRCERLICGRSRRRFVFGINLLSLHFKDASLPQATLRFMMANAVNSLKEKFFSATVHIAQWK